MCYFIIKSVCTTVFFREAIEKEKKKQDYQRLHAMGKTDEARSDLARLQLIRKQRDDAAKKREADRLGKIIFHFDSHSIVKCIFHIFQYS